MKMSYEDLTGLNSPHPYAEDFSIEVYREKTNNVKFSFVIPVFNKEKQIEPILNQLCLVAPRDSEFIIINDASEDNTYKVIRSWVKTINSDCKIINCTVPFFETACDNIGFSLSRGEFICEFQSDLQINDVTFFYRAELAFQNFNILSLSGRCGQPWFSLLSRWMLFKNMVNQKNVYLKRSSYQIGKVNKEIYKNNIIGDQKGVYFTDTNNRGPWILKRKTLNSNLLDSDNFFLGYDDHQFNFMYSSEDLRPAYLPCKVFCVPHDGSTRQIRNGLNNLVFNWLKNNKPGQKKFLEEIVSHKSKILEFRELNITISQKYIDY